MTYLLPWILMMSSVAQATECFRNETDPSTGSAFASQEVYQSTIDHWAILAPSRPGFVALARAYSVYKKEKAFADTLNDKVAHCYVGCRISQTTEYRVAEYVGWLKEDRDIKDCNVDTHFDVGDFDATLRGAQIGQSESDAKGCFNTCSR